MFRVRKISRRRKTSAGADKRPRIPDFQLAQRRIKRRAEGLDSATFSHIAEFNRECQAPRGAQKTLESIRQGQSVSIIAPLSDTSLPSMAEVLRVISAISLGQTLEARKIGPCVVTLWPGIPAELDQFDRLMISRTGEVQPVLRQHEHKGKKSSEIITGLPQTEFTDWVQNILEETWHSNPAVWKVRLLFKFVARRNAIAAPMDTSLETSNARPRTPRAEYRTHLARLIERFAVLCLVHPDQGETMPIDRAASTSFSGDVIPFPAATATIIENKVERWLEKYDLKAEQFLSNKLHIPKLIASLVPSDSDGAVARAREALLGKLFRLENQLKAAGYAERGTRVTDKLASQVDAQFDRLRASARKSEKRVRETAFDQLTKARNYLVPDNRPQAHAMGLIHYLNFYGPGFIDDLRESIGVGDGRHYLLYLGS